MSQYYYAAASLPLLLYDNKPQLKIEEFVKNISMLLSPSDARKVLSAKIFDGYPTEELSNLAKEYWYYEKGLRNELVKLRASSLSQDAKNFIYDYEENPFVSEIALAAFKSESPLASEMLINSWRWQIVDRLESGHYFDVDFFSAYYLKLQILERKGLFDYQVGKTNFNGLYENLLNTKTNESGV